MNTGDLLSKLAEIDETTRAIEDAAYLAATRAGSPLARPFFAAEFTRGNYFAAAVKFDSTWPYRMNVGHGGRIG